MRALLLFLMLSACGDKYPQPADDLDGDGYGSDVDCNDADGSLSPGSPEVCNGVDDDCDGLVDERLQDASFHDGDGDGFGDPVTMSVGCGPIAGGDVRNGDDCDDALGAIHPGATEVCDGKDDNCDGQVDENVGSTFYADTDGDGFGDGPAIVACTQPTGTSATAGDCDDGRPDVKPGALEVCDGVDQDCDGAIDDGLPSVTSYTDGDGDGFGDPLSGQVTCGFDDGHVANGDDCDDADPAVSPVGVEVCDGLDDDCDSLTDEEGGTDPWYRDADGDGFGDSGQVVQGCFPPSGFVGVNGDCNDGAAAVFPGAVETCDGVDTNCTAGETDATDPATFYTDADQDGFGDAASPVLACTQPSGTVAVAGDCDDGDAAITSGSTYYADRDNDGFGDASVSVVACTQPSDMVLDPTDCDDAHSNVNPSRPETCNGVDNDCSGDESDASDASTWYLDADLDGHGVVGTTTADCTQPQGYAAAGDDCDDSLASVNPDASEVCNGVDDDCNGLDDDGAIGSATWYVDSDQDGLGDPNNRIHQCTPPSGTVGNGDDCDDSNASIGGPSTWYTDADADGFGDATAPVVACVQPAGTVVDSSDCDDGDDRVTDGATFYADTDQDGFGDATVTAVACSAPTGFTGNSADCNDAAAAVNPNAVETCDGVDTNCSGDESDSTDAGSWYADGDADSYGAGAATVTCLQPSGTVGVSGDCDDGNAAINPGAIEFCDGTDNNCSGDETDAVGPATWYRDADGDGHGRANRTIQSCSQPTGYVASSDDCDDADGTVNPDAVETCDGVDTNCSGDESDATDTTAFYADGDNDGFGAGAAVQACQSPGSGFTSDDTDCDDATSAVHPGAAETCDGVDSNCTGGEADATDRSTWFVDGDSDGFGGSTAVLSCTQPNGAVLFGGDCNDLDENVHPLAVETCDGIDTNCSGDESDTTDGLPFHPDADSDTYGDSSVTVTACTAPFGDVADGTDCDDLNGAVNPAATEVCNGVDDNCTLGETDATNPSTWYADTDGDNYGDTGSTTQACTKPSGFVGSPGDCDDNAANVHPTLPETCNGVDNNCSGDEADASDRSTFYADVDTDTYGNAAGTTLDCVAPPGYVVDSTDCDDGNGAVHPGAAEPCDGIDNNCSGDESDATGFMTWYRDNDSDTYGDVNTTQQQCLQPSGFVSDSTDCNDGNGAIHPGATEVCNGIDDNCAAGETDATSPPTWYADADTDTFGDPDASVSQCDPPPGSVANSLDCNDGDGAINPNATEVCDASDVDEDCDGGADDADPQSAVGQQVWYVDSDLDSYGDPNTGVTSCDPVAFSVTNPDDCDDGNIAINPAATEVCDGADTDEDCANGADDNDPNVDAGSLGTWYVDNDGDGYGPDASQFFACDPAGPSSDVGGDCDDGVKAVNPAALEVCDAGNVDDDCDGFADDADPEGAETSGMTTYYSDGDLDGFGVTSSAAQACDPPSDSASVGGDCDDAAPTAHPGGTEACDALDVDEDCDGSADDTDGQGATGKQTWYTDTDLDNYGVDGTGVDYCDPPSAVALAAGDCDDGASAVNPGAAEMCDPGDVDEDCDTLADDSDPDGASGMTAWYDDGDTDGYGDGLGLLACDAPFGFVALNGDCDDGNASISPGDPEVCDASNVDEDCDGQADDLDPQGNATGKTTWYTDGDTDGYGTGAGTALCDQPAGTASVNGDCEDGNASISPGDPEVCDASNVDEDCDGFADDLDPQGNATGKTTFYTDGDGDGYGADNSAQSRCDGASGLVTQNGDCVDSNGGINPGAAEICEGSVDEDCDNTIDFSINALDFDGGTTDRVQIPDSADFALGTTFTVEAWVYYDSASSGWVYSEYEHSGPSGGTTHEYKYLWVWNDASVETYFRSAGGSDIQLNTSAGVLNVDEWNHIAWVYNAPANHVFVNGVDAGGGSNNLGFNYDPADRSDGSVRIGYPGGTDGSADGLFADLRISNIARYSSTFTPASDLPADGNTVALWRMNEGSGTTVGDSSGQGNPGTTAGSPTWVAAGCRPGQQL